MTAHNDEARRREFDSNYINPVLKANFKPTHLNCFGELMMCLGVDEKDRYLYYYPGDDEPENIYVEEIPYLSIKDARAIIKKLDQA